MAYEPSGTIFVRQLPHGAGINYLPEKCSTYGHILISRIIRDGSGDSRCYGFVTFDSVDAAIRTVDRFTPISVEHAKVNTKNCETPLNF